MKFKAFYIFTTDVRSCKPEAKLCSLCNPGGWFPWLIIPSLIEGFILEGDLVPVTDAKGSAEFLKFAINYK